MSASDPQVARADDPAADAERSVLGAALRDDAAAAGIAAGLLPDYADPRHRRIAAAIGSLRRQGAPTDPIAVADALGDRIAEAGGMPHLLDLLDATVTSAGTDYHAEIVRTAARRRHLEELGRAIQQQAADGADPAEMAAEIRQRLDGLAGTGSRAIAPADLIDRWEQEGELVHVPTGIPALDDMTGGGPTLGSACIVVGAPDAGKTLLLVVSAEATMRHGCAVGFFSVDEWPDDTMQRLLQRREFSRERCERRDPHDLARMRAALADLPLQFYDDSHTIESAAADLAAFAAARGMPAMLCVDSVQTVTCDGERNDTELRHAVTARARALRAVANRHRMIVFAASEMSRRGYANRSQKDNAAGIATGKESGTLEFAARLLVTLTNVAGQPDLVELRVEKNKLGPSRRHGDGEPGIPMRMHRGAQTMIQDGSPLPATRDDARATIVDQRATEDAARVAAAIAEQPGRPVRKLRAAVRGMGRDRFGVARERLGLAVLEVGGRNNANHLYLDGRHLPAEVVGAMPPDQRARALAARPPAGVCPSVPECAGHTGAGPGSECAAPYVVGAATPPPPAATGHQCAAPDADDIGEQYHAALWGDR